MARRFIDLSITLCNDVVSDPPFLKPEITYQTHGETVPNWAISSPASRRADLDGAGFAAPNGCA
jgi:hypothetical protein